MTKSPSLPIDLSVSDYDRLLKALSLSKRSSSSKLRSLLSQSASAAASPMDLSQSMMQKAKIRWKCYTLPNSKGSSVLFATGRRKKHSRVPSYTPEFIKKASHHTEGFQETAAQKKAPSASASASFNSCPESENHHQFSTLSSMNAMKTPPRSTQTQKWTWSQCETSSSLSPSSSSSSSMSSNEECVLSSPEVSPPTSPSFMKTTLNNQSLDATKPWPSLPSLSSLTTTTTPLANDRRESFSSSKVSIAAILN